MRIIEISESDNEFEVLEIESLEKQLEENQLDPITSGSNYNQTDILRHLKKLK